MTKLIRIIFINLLNLFDINKIIIANNNNTKSGYEYKPILLVVLSIVIGYISYQLLLIPTTLLNNKLLIINISFIISTLLSLFISLYISKKELFNTDSEYLFSLPVSKNQIIISKLFQIYIKNILFVLIIMSMSLLAYSKFLILDKTTILIMYILSFFIPIIPIIISSIIYYLFTYLDTNKHKIISILIKLLLLIIFLFIYNKLNTNISTSNIDNLFTSIINKTGIIYIPILIFNYSISHNSLLALLSLILLSLLINIIFIKYLSNNYIKLNSLIKSIKVKNNFKYHKVKKHTKFISLLIKEKNILLNNKKYFTISYNSTIIFTIIIFIILNVINTNNINTKYIFLLPTILSTIVCLNSLSISSISIEKNNIEVLKTYPIKPSKIILSKYILSIIISLIFIIINSTLINIYLNINNFLIMMNYILPIVSILSTNLLYLTLDLTFPNREEQDDNIILTGRIICYIPPIIAIIIGILPLFFPLYADYKIVLLCITFILIICFIINIIYLLIKEKKLFNKLTR